MEFSQLRSFIEVARHGNLTRAADRLHLSQPAISAQIKQLEEELGGALFHRSSSGMALTPVGKRLLPHAETVLHAAQELRDTARALQGDVAANLRLGTVLDGSVVRVGDLLTRALVDYPHVDVELHQIVSFEALPLLRAGDLDASFFFGPDPGPEFGAVRLREIGYRVATPAAWARELADAGWETLVERPWVVTPEGSSHRGLVLQMFGEHGARPERMIEADNESLILNLVESGVGISLVREEVAQPAVEEGRLAFWQDVELRTGLWLVYPLGRRDDAVIDALLRMIVEVWGLPEDVIRPVTKPAPARTGRSRKATLLADKTEFRSTT